MKRKPSHQPSSSSPELQHFFHIVCHYCYSPTAACPSLPLLVCCRCLPVASVHWSAARSSPPLIGRHCLPVAHRLPPMHFNLHLTVDAAHRSVCPSPAASAQPLPIASACRSANCPSSTTSTPQSPFSTHHRHFYAFAQPPSVA